MYQHIIHNFVETIAHRLQKGCLNFWLMNQDPYQPEINLLDVLLIEHLNTEVLSLRKILVQ